MNMKQRFVAVISILVIGLCYGLSSVQLMPAAAQVPGQNLLVNGDFETGGGGAWPFQDGIAEVQVAPGWRAFWLNEPPAYANPSSIDYWARPEFRDTKRIEYAYRVHGGDYAQKYFTFGRQHEAGLYQQVSNITPGTPLRFQIYMQTWSCTAEGEWNNCPTGYLSNQPAPMNTRVGIDPTGGTNPWAATVVWAPVIETHDRWTLFSVEATAQAGTVTVFTYSRVDWGGGWARLNNDVYIDSASLVSTGEAQPTVPPPPTPGALPTAIVPQVTPTPRPDGAVVHVVQSGDTLLGIAIQYGVELEELQRLNAGTLGPGNLIIVGQEIIISGTPIALPTPVLQVATPITLPVVTTPETPDSAVALTTASSTTAALCVLAYNDANTDLLRQVSSEGLVPGTVISLFSTNGPAGSYTTDGLSEPYCFQNLQPGNYVLRHTPSNGYAASGPAEWGVLLSAGQTYALELGYVWNGSNDSTEGQASPEPVAATVESEEESTGIASTLMTIVRISGIIVALLAVGVAVLFFLSRRHA